MARIGDEMRKRIPQEQQSATTQAGKYAGIQAQQNRNNGEYNGYIRQKESPIKGAMQGQYDYGLVQGKQQPQGVTQDPYAAQANALYQQLLSRGPFTYDLQGDMLYRQYADQYSQLGRQAMMDATGTAAGLTGGYGNSFANMVGNQAYQQYMGQLNAMIPDFYDRAYQRWLDQGDLMLQQYQLAQSRAGGSGGGGKTAAGTQAAGYAPTGAFQAFASRYTPEQWQQYIKAASPMDVIDYDELLRRMNAGSTSK